MPVKYYKIRYDLFIQPRFLPRTSTTCSDIMSCAYIIPLFLLFQNYQDFISCIIFGINDIAMTSLWSIQMCTKDEWLNLVCVLALLLI